MTDRQARIVRCMNELELVERQFKDACDLCPCSSARWIGWRNFTA